ncbi:MAG TPA: hypothetical protein PLI53_04065, partial [Geobacteraceae bacterium]|nr:hypothetical protein [Geobacteraceae bacterium]
EKAKFNIGTRVPITTTTTNGTATGYSVNVQYVDVGVKVDAEPIIQRNNDINIKLSLEVSSIVGKEKLGDGTTTVVTIGTRNLQTVLSLKDGETSVIGGLIARTNTDSKTKLFLLGDIPLIGPLLSGNDTSKDKTELVLAITPRLVRGVTVAPNNMAAFMSGKEDHPSLQPYPAADDMDALLAEESEPQAPGINRNQVARPQAAVSPTKSVHRPTPGAPSLQHSGAMPPVPPNTPILPPRPGMSQSSAPLQPGTRRPATAQQASPRLHGAAPAAHATGIMQPVAPRTNPAQPSPIPVPTGGQDSANPAHAHITAVAPAVAMSQPSPTQQGAVQAPSPSNPGENADVPRPGANPAPAASSSTETADERR